jgi:membrane protein DedA with SNARE-associated domain
MKVFWFFFSKKNILFSFEEAPIEAFVTATLEFIRANQAYAAPMVFLLAFGESLAVVSLLLPATAILFGVSGLLGASGVPFWPVWAAAASGAILGDVVSYWIGFHFKDGLARRWPLTRAPDLLPRGQRFFAKWGIAGVFIGRFFGPLRAAVPLVAGSCAMPLVPFMLANVASALVWATGILVPGLVAIFALG